MPRYEFHKRVVGRRIACRIRRGCASGLVLVLAAALLAVVPELASAPAHAVATQKTFLPSTLVFGHSGRCLDVSLSVDGQADGAQIYQWDCLGARNQTWTLTPAGTVNGVQVFTVRAQHSGKCLDVASSATADGSPVHQWTCNGGTNQQWYPVRVNGGEPAGVYELKGVASGRCLEIRGGGVNNGVQAEIQTCSSSKLSQRLKMRVYGAAGEAPAFRFKTFPISDTAALKVNVASGNLMYTQTDLAAPGLGVGLGLVRYYNSMSEPLGTNRTSHLGNDWQLNLGGDVYQDQLAEGGRIGVRVRMPSGYSAFFADTGASVLTSPLGFTRYEMNKTTGYSLRRKDTGETMEFGQSGLLTAVKDRFGNKISTRYALNNQTVSLTDSLGRLVTFTYTSSNYATGKVSSIKDWASREVVYTYDTAGNLRSAKDPTGKTISYDYDANGRLSKVTDARGYATTIAYDSQGRVHQVHQPTQTYQSTFYYNQGRTPCTFAGVNFQAPEPPLPTSVIDSTGITAPDIPRMAKYCYDTEGRVVRTVGRNGDVTQQTFGSDSEKSEFGWGDGATVNRFDGLKRVLERTGSTGAKVKYNYSDAANPYLPTSYTDQAGNVSTIGYANGQVTRVTDPLGASQEFTYNTNGTVATSKDRRGNQTTYGYNTSGQLISITRPILGATSLTYDTVGRVATVTDGKGQQTTITYDNLNRYARLRYADGTSVSYDYDANGNVIKRTDANSSGVATSTSSYTYDALNRLKTETLPGGKVHSYTYDDRGFLTSFTDGTEKTTYLRTEAGYLYKVIAPDGKETFVGFAWGPGQGGELAPSAIPSFASQPVEVRYPNGLSVYQGMDRANRVVRTALYRTADNQELGDVSKALLDYRYSYTRGDGVDTPLLHKVTDAKTEVVTYYDYDARNRLRSRTVENPDGTVRSNLVYNYDATGNRIVDYYALVIRHSGKCLDVRFASHLEGATLQQMSCKNNGAQNFSFQLMPGGYYRLMNADSGKCLDVQESSTADGAIIHQWRCHNGPNQQFRLTYLGGGYYTFAARHSGKCLDVRESSTADEARIHQWTCHNGTNQQFALRLTSANPIYNTANQLTNDGSGDLTYDANGNLIGAPQSFTATYNAKNQTTTMTGMGNPSFIGTGQTELTKVGTTSYENAAALGITRIGADTYTRAPGGALISMNTAANGKHYYVRDPQGNVLATLDAAGNISSTYDYTPHGASVTSGNVASPFRFQSELLVNPSRHIYKIGERFYDANKGRWTQADPVETENRYIYANGDPINRNDPTGLLTDAECGGIAAIIGGGLGYILGIGINELMGTEDSQWSGLLNFMTGVTGSGYAGTGVFWKLKNAGKCSPRNGGKGGGGGGGTGGNPGPRSGPSSGPSAGSPSAPPEGELVDSFARPVMPSSTPSQPDVESGISAAALATAIAGTLVGHCT